MGFKCGIVGLPNAGKTTIFNALSGASAHVASYPFTTIDPNTAIVPVPDARLDEIAGALKPEKVTPAVMEFVDIAGLVKGASDGEGLGNQFLSHIRAVDALIHVVRCFVDKDVAHPDGTVDPVRDIEVVNTELILSDLEIAERRVDKLTRMVKVGGKEAVGELKLFTRVKEMLNREVPLRSSSFPPEEAQILETAGLLTIKPVLYVANMGENGAGEPTLKALRAAVEEAGGKIVVISGKLEAEISALPLEERAVFFEEMGLEEGSLARLIRAGYGLLDLITFFTIVGKEVRAWTIPRGTSAFEAAGKIHTDFQKGFVRAEVIPFSDFHTYGSEHRVKEAGHMRLEGRDYQVQDGDIIRFRFTP